MNRIAIAVVSAPEFERARALIAGFAPCGNFDDWLDGRQGRWISLSLAGADATLETVAIDDFLAWCGASGIPPSETALDEFALLPAPESGANRARVYPMLPRAPEPGETVRTPKRASVALGL